MANPIVHFEIMGGKGKDLEKFYSELFSWNIDSNNPQNYGMITNTPEGTTAGAVGDGENGTRVTVYASVDDINKTLEQVEKLGGKVVMPRTEIPDTVIMAMFSDPAGNINGLVEGSM